MALPELLEPPGLPCWLLGGHGIAPDPLHDDFGALQGEGRKRKVQTAAPQYVQVSRDLSAAQAATYDDFFENALGVGNAQFTTEIASLGAGSRYWAAQWVDPPQWTPRATATGVRWRLDGRLLLTGEGSDVLPLGATLATEYVLALMAEGSISSGVALATEYVVALIGALPLATEYVVALLRVVPSYELREDGGRELREDGGFELRE